MPEFSHTSLQRLASCDMRLQTLFHAVITQVDCSILEGHRSRDRQEAAYARGQSKLHWPRSKHNARPSLAVDAAPWPIDWDDRDRFHLFGGIVLGTAKQLGIALRWGGDWDGDFQTRDNRFDDLVHFEVRSKLP
ncbi:MAG: M15 family peptidase [Pseudomonadota bacterium]